MQGLTIPKEVNYMTKEKMVKVVKGIIVVMLIAAGFMAGGLANSARRTYNDSYSYLVSNRDGNTVVSKVTDYGAWYKNTYNDFFTSYEVK